MAYGVEYRKEYGDYAYYVNGELQFMSHSIAVMGVRCYDGSIFLHKHGSPERIHKLSEVERKKLLDSGLEEWAEGLFVIESDRWPLEDLNRCLKVSGYLQQMLETLEQNNDRE